MSFSASGLAARKNLQVALDMNEDEKELIPMAGVLERRDSKHPASISLQQHHSSLTQELDLQPLRVHVCDVHSISKSKERLKWSRFFSVCLQKKCQKQESEY